MHVWIFRYSALVFLSFPFEGKSGLFLMIIVIFFVSFFVKPFASVIQLTEWHEVFFLSFFSLPWKCDHQLLLSSSDFFLRKYRAVDLATPIVRPVSLALRPQRLPYANVEEMMMVIKHQRSQTPKPNIT